MNSFNPIYPEYIRVVPTTIIRKVGQDALFLCHSNKTKTWKFRKGNKPSNARIYEVDKKLYLMFEKVNWSNRGIYKCEVNENKQYVDSAIGALYISK